VNNAPRGTGETQEEKSCFRVEGKLYWEGDLKVMRERRLKMRVDAGIGIVLYVKKQENDVAALHDPCYATSDPP